MEPTPAHHAKRYAFSREEVAGSRGRTKVLVVALLLLSMGLVIWHNAGASQEQPVTEAKMRRLESAPASRQEVRTTDHAKPANAIRLCQVLSPADPNPIPGGRLREPLPAGTTRRRWDADGPGVGISRNGPRANTWAGLACRTCRRIGCASTTSWTSCFASPATRFPTPYKLNVGDEVTIESTTDTELRRNADRVARRHDYAAAVGPGARRQHERAATARRARQALREVLQHAGDHGHAGQGRHAARRPALHGRRPIGLRRPGSLPDASRRKARSNCRPSARCRPRA